MTNNKKRKNDDELQDGVQKHPRLVNSSPTTPLEEVNLDLSLSTTQSSIPISDPLPQHAPSPPRQQQPPSPPPPQSNGFAPMAGPNDLPDPNPVLLPNTIVAAPVALPDTTAAVENEEEGKRNKNRKNKSKTVPVPYPWATDRRAIIHSFKHLVDHGIQTISGEVQCRRCEKSHNLEYNLQEKLNEVVTFIQTNQPNMHMRAPTRWMNPTLPTCNLCGQENSCRPLILKKRSVNWLFLFLGQLLGCCTLKQLKFFCKHTNNHRTGAKDRVLYLTYIELCKQLDPTLPIDYHH